MREDWQDKLDFMRKNGVDEAEWSSDGKLICAKLGLDPNVKSGSTREAIDPHETRMRTLLGGVSKLVPSNG